MNPFSFASTRQIEFGNGKLDALGELVQTRSTGPVVLITDPGIIATGMVASATASLEASGLSVSVYSDVEADPPESRVLEAVAFAHDNDAATIVGLGGGSSLDVAKLVALLAMGGQALSDVYGIGNARGPRLPLVLVPTTAGTGSEVTPISIITTGATTKMGVVSPWLLPDIAILDPALTLGLPAATTAATGIDAMVHAIEAYASASPNNNPLSRTLAEKALRLIGGALTSAVHDGTNLDARADMLLGSTLAGQAFANSPVAAVHALAYPLGGHFHIPHGLSNALVLPHVLRFNIGTSSEPYSELAPLVFPALAKIPRPERAEHFCTALAELSAACTLPQRLRELDIPESALATLADDAMLQTRLLVNNPREVTRDDALAIYEKAY